MSNEQTNLQLKVFSEISNISKEQNIEFWLRGGWAIDFLLGKITRSHDDIDLVTWIHNRKRLENELLKAGYEKIPVDEQFIHRQSDFRKGTVEVSYVYITHSAEGDLIVNGLPEWVWRTDSLLSQKFLLHGTFANVLHPKQLFEEKEVYEQIGRIPRLKDLESKKILLGIIKGSY